MRIAYENQFFQTDIKILTDSARSICRSLESTKKKIIKKTIILYLLDYFSIRLFYVYKFFIFSPRHQKKCIIHSETLSRI